MPRIQTRFLTAHAQIDRVRHLVYAHHLLQFADQLTQRAKPELIRDATKALSPSSVIGDSTLKMALECIVVWPRLKAFPIAVFAEMPFQSRDARPRSQCREECNESRSQCHGEAEMCRSRIWMR